VRLLAQVRRCDFGPEHVESPAITQAAGDSSNDCNSRLEAEDTALRRQLMVLRRKLRRFSRVAIVPDQTKVSSTGLIEGALY
jgi:hypothetical protein